MLNDLATFFLETEGGRNIPRSLRPSVVRNVSRSLLGHGGRIIAEYTLDDGSRFQISQQKPGGDMWVDGYRANGTMLQQQSYHPFAKAYTTIITDYDEAGKKLTHYRALASDDRVVEEVVRTPDQQFEGIIHQYADLHGVGHAERSKYGRDIRCHHKVERRYNDTAGTSMLVDTHFGPDQNCTHEVHYNETTQKIDALVEFQPGRRVYKLVSTFDDNGIKDSEEFYDKDGVKTRYVEYVTEGATKENESPLPIKVEWLYQNGVQQTELRYHEDGVIRMRRDYEADGKTTKTEQYYNSTGEYAREIREYTQGKLTRKLQMSMHGDDVEVKRIILYSGGKPYRSREHHRWTATGDDFWADTEIDPQTGNPAFSIMQTPTGELIRQSYDTKTGRLHITDHHREEFLGETLESRIHYFPGPQTVRHPEKQTPSVVRRKEHFEEDGQTLHHAKEFRIDGSIKSAEQREPDGSWTHRIYAPGTKQIDENTTPIFESVHRPDGTKESSTLRAHNDPTIIALHKFYDEKGKPSRVQIDSIDGEENLAWEDYVQRRQHQHASTSLAPVTLATIHPDIRNKDNGEEHYGRTVITLQGTEAALAHTKRRLEQYYPHVQTDLRTGSRQMLQYKNHIGRYIEHSPDLENHPLVEKVSVLTVALPYQRIEGDEWPKHFDKQAADSDIATLYNKRGIEEAGEALKKICRHSCCDLGLNFRAEVSSHSNEDGQLQYYPYVVVSWPNKPYLPQAQCEIISEMLSDQMMMRSFFCSHIPGQNSIDIFVSNGAATPDDASRIAASSSKELYNVLTPAPFRKSEPEKQL